MRRLASVTRSIETRLVLETVLRQCLGLGLDVCSIDGLACL